LSVVAVYLVILAGVAFISAGVSLYSFPAGFIVAGVLLILIAVDSRT